MNLPNYLPILKTSDSEIRGFSHLQPEVKDSVLPFFELTRSRRSKKVEEGDIYRRLNKIQEELDGRPYVLDLTTLDDLSNSQIEKLLIPDNGFGNWCSFIEDIADTNVIPVIHGLDDDPNNDVAAEVNRLDKLCPFLAFRAGLFDADVSDFVEGIVQNMSNPEKLILVLDAGFMRQTNLGAYAEVAVDKIKKVLEFAEPGRIFVAGTSFPRAVTDIGSEVNDQFPLAEVEFYRLIQDELGKGQVSYGDYATVHPIRYDVRGGNWIPRVDIPLDKDVIYYRYRRNEGGYIEAASRALNDWDAALIDCWGTDQIRAAAAGNPGGRSPSYWISVRINSHITRRVFNPL